MKNWCTWLMVESSCVGLLEREREKGTEERELVILFNVVEQNLHLYIYIKIEQNFYLVKKNKK